MDIKLGCFIASSSATVVSKRPISQINYVTKPGRSMQLVDGGGAESPAPCLVFWTSRTNYDFLVVSVPGGPAGYTYSHPPPPGSKESWRGGGGGGRN